MKSGTAGRDSRRGSRTKAVFPVRVKGKDRAGQSFEELAHTLDVTPSGVRLGAIHHELNLFDEITVFYRQRKMQFRVMWTKKLKGTSEFQVGLQTIAQEKEAWGGSFSEGNQHSTSEPAIRQASV